MEPITLRLPSDLLEELDAESDEAGFSTRSEYIRHLLFNRPDLSQLAAIEGSTAPPEAEQIEEIDQTVGELTERVEILTQRVTELEGETASRGGDSSTSPVNSTSETPSTAGESTTEEQSGGGPQSEEGNADLAEFEHWLESDGPQSDNARTVLLDAARILDGQGPLKASDLRQRLFDRHPEAYDSAEALWASTVERLYDDLPGFDRPEYGQYTFNRDDL
ncbi:ribbon-helix-helix domain-containing protein [Halorubrum sp. DM2]|uniref:ribbon-helix-helix domain-containing protein n=1 Tax=Halorubrum sp. DM2 TaxID=2527867 RepID=UPI0024B6AB67|nr:ribbon-helix-helix domain-containing protein [Halorubrum sp. DM2]